MKSKKKGNKLLPFILRHTLWQLFGQNCSFRSLLILWDIINPLNRKSKFSKKFNHHFPICVLWTMTSKLILGEGSMLKQALGNFYIIFYISRHYLQFQSMLIVAIIYNFNLSNVYWSPSVFQALLQDPEIVWWIKQIQSLP